MAVQSIGSSSRPKVAPWNDPVIRGWVFQIVVVGLVGLLAWYLVSNTVDNLARQKIASGFHYLEREAGFEIGDTMIEYSPASTYARAILVGLLNTLFKWVTGANYSPINVYSWGGVVWHMIQYSTPFLFLFIVDIFRAMDPALEESSRMCGASRWRRPSRSPSARSPHQTRIARVPPLGEEGHGHLVLDDRLGLLLHLLDHRAGVGTEGGREDHLHLGALRPEDDLLDERELDDVHPDLGIDDRAEGVEDRELGRPSLGIEGGVRWGARRLVHRAKSYHPTRE